VKVVMPLMLAAASIACGRPETPVGSTSPTPVSVVTGVVYESTVQGNHPLAGVGIDVSPEDRMPASQMAVTDADGRYSVPFIELDSKVVGTKSGYAQPCYAPVSAAVHGVLDIYLVSNELLSTTGMPASVPVAQPTLSGVVFELGADGRHPLAGTLLQADVSGGMGWAPGASSVADANGRYVLCGLTKSTFGLSIAATRDGYMRADQFVDPTLTPMLDIELKRQ